MCKTWRTTCVSLLLLGPLLTACGGDDVGPRTTSAAGSSAEPSATSAAGSSAEPSGPPAPGVYGQPLDPDAPEPTDVATDAPVPASAPRGQVAPRLTYFGWVPDIGAVEAGGIVTSIVEAGGICTLTMSQGATEVEATSQAVVNATSTSCPAMVITGDRVTPGAWRAVLTYESETAQGVSEPVQIEVP